MNTNKSKIKSALFLVSGLALVAASSAANAQALGDPSLLSRPGAGVGAKSNPSPQGGPRVQGGGSSGGARGTGVGSAVGGVGAAGSAAFGAQRQEPPTNQPPEGVMYGRQMDQPRTLEELKTKILTFLTETEQKIQNHRACVTAATDIEQIKACNPRQAQR